MTSLKSSWRNLQDPASALPPSHLISFSLCLWDLLFKMTYKIWKFRPKGVARSGNLHSFSPPHNPPLPSCQTSLYFFLKWKNTSASSRIPNPSIAISQLSIILVRLVFFLFYPFLLGWVTNQIQWSSPAIIAEKHFTKWAIKRFFEGERERRRETKIFEVQCLCTLRYLKSSLKVNVLFFPVESQMRQRVWICLGLSAWP